MTDVTGGQQRDLSPTRVVLTVLAPFALCYFFSYLYRAVNAVIAPDLVRDVGLGASELGLLTAAYLIGFAGFQLPLGLLLDRFGPRRVQAVLLCAAAAGALIFAVASGLWALSFGRMLIGIGCAGGLMAGFKAVVLFVPEGRRAFANASIMAFGGLGILAATVPAEFAAAHIGWRAMFLALAVLTVAAAATLYAAVPERGSTAGRGPDVAAQVAALGSILTDRVFWRVAPFVALSAGTHIGIQTLWSGPWLRDVAGLDRDGVAATLALQATGFLVGTLFTGYIADRLARRGIGLLTTMTCLVVVFMGVQLVVLFEPVAWVRPLWLVFGMFGQAGILAYPWLAGYFGSALAGRSNGAINTLVFVSAFAVQSAMGWIIDLWPPTEAGGYDREAYRVAFGVFLCLQVAGLAWFLLGRPAAWLRKAPS